MQDTALKVNYSLRDTQMMRIVLMIGTRALLDGRLGREASRACDRERILDDLARRLDSARKANGTATG